MRTLRRGVTFFGTISVLCSFLLCGPLATGGRACAQPAAATSPTAAMTAPASSTASSLGPQPLYRIAGYERREEALFKPSDFRAVLGPAGYRQWVASRVLLIIGGVAAFSGAVAVLATLGSLGQNTDYGTMAQLGYSGAYRNYVIGFSALLGAGGAMVATGLILSLPLPPRRRTLFVPLLQVVESPRF